MSEVIGILAVRVLAAIANVAARYVGGRHNGYAGNRRIPVNCAYTP